MAVSAGSSFAPAGLEGRCLKKAICAEPLLASGTPAVGEALLRARRPVAPVNEEP